MNEHFEKQFIYLRNAAYFAFILRKYFLNACYILCTVVGCGDLAVSHIDKSLSFQTMEIAKQRP